MSPWVRSTLDDFPSSCWWYLALPAALCPQAMADSKTDHEGENAQGKTNGPERATLRHRHFILRPNDTPEPIVVVQEQHQRGQCHGCSNRYDANPKGQIDDDDIQCNGGS